MKKILLSITLILTACSVSFAQSAFSSSASTFSAGIGVGTPYFGGGYSSSIPVNPTITYEKGITEGISAGAEVSYAGSKFYGLNVNAIYVGVRGSYHLGQFVDLGKNADLYGGVGVGYVLVTVSDNAGDSATAASSDPGYGVYAGGRYFFTPSVAVYAEVGYQSLSYLNIGVAFKL